MYTGTDAHRAIKRTPGFRTGLVRLALRVRCLTVCFSTCSSSARASLSQRDREAIHTLLQTSIDEIAARASCAERQLMVTQRQLRLLVINVDSDPFPDVLLHRIKMHVGEQHILDQELTKIRSATQQLKLQQATVRDSDLNSEVLEAMRTALRSTRRYSGTVQAAELLLDELLQQRADTAEVTHVLGETGEDSDTEDPAPLNWAECEKGTSAVSHADCIAPVGRRRDTHKSCTEAERHLRNSLDV